MVSVEDVALLMVKFNVITLSQPAALATVQVAVLLDAVYVLPCHTKLLQAVIVSVDDFCMQIMELLEAHEFPALFKARIIIELGSVAKPVMVKGLVVAAGDTAAQLIPLFVEYS